MIVVTGAAGFIGSNVVAALNAAGRGEIAAVDNPASFDGAGNLVDLRMAERVPKDELADWVTSRASKIEAIIHLGACSDTTQTDRAFMLRNNFEYTQRLWEFCAQRQIRFVYASSAATYGDGSAGYDDAADPRRLKPLNLYGESKQLFDLWALEQSRAPAGWAGLKFFNVYGPREQHKGRMASVVFHAFNQIRQTGRVKLFKSDRADVPDGGQKRDFIYVKDAVAAVLHFVNLPANNSTGSQQQGCPWHTGLFNIGTGQARAFEDLARAVFRALKLEPRIEFIPMPADLKGRYQYFTQATTQKLRASGFTQPLHSLEEGVTDYVSNYLMAQR